MVLKLNGHGTGSKTDTNWDGMETKRERNRHETEWNGNVTRTKEVQ